jgi:hypothetical protein
MNSDNQLQKFGKLIHIFICLYVDYIFWSATNALNECKLGVKTLIVLASNLLTLSVPDEDYYRNILSLSF